MHKNVVVVLFSAVLMSAGSAFAAGDSIAGQAKSAVCAACHGPSGVSTNPEWPNIVGQKPSYIVKQLKAFRDGSRANPLMSPMAKPLSDADIEDLAAFFSRQNG